MKETKFQILLNEKKLSRDAQTFLWSSTGAHSPSLISQGKIGQLVIAKPVERDYFRRAQVSPVYTSEDMKLKQD